MEAFHVSGIPPPNAEPSWMEDKRHLWFDVEKLAKTCGTPSPDFMKNQMLEKYGARHSPGMPMVTSNRYRALPKPRYSKVPSQRSQRSLPAKSTPALTSTRTNTSMSMMSLELDWRASSVSPGSKTTKSNIQSSRDHRAAPREGQTMKSRGHQQTRESESRDTESSDLTQQIDELTIALKEKELFYNNDLRKIVKGAEETEARLREEHRIHIKALEDDQKEEIEKVRDFHQRLIEDIKKNAEQKEAALQKDVENLTKSLQTLEGKFEDNLNSRLRQRETEVRLEMQRIADGKLKDQQHFLIQQKIMELDSQAMEHSKQVNTILYDHRKEIDKLYRRFAASTMEAEKLKDTVDEMESLRKENEEMREELLEARNRIRKLDNELADVKVKLTGYQEHFAEKVSEVDDKYVMRIRNLIAQNTDLRQAHVRKCDELFNMQSSMENKQGQAVSSAKDAIKAAIEARKRSHVDLPEGTPIDKDEIPTINQERPRSAPSKEGISATHSQEANQLLSPSDFEHRNNQSAPNNPAIDKIGKLSRRAVKSAGPGRTRKNRMDMMK